MSRRLAPLSAEPTSPQMRESTEFRGKKAGLRGRCGLEARSGGEGVKVEGPKTGVEKYFFEAFRAPINVRDVHRADLRLPLRAFSAHRPHESEGYEGHMSVSNVCLVKFSKVSGFSTPTSEVLFANELHQTSQTSLDVSGGRYD